MFTGTFDGNDLSDSKNQYFAWERQSSDSVDFKRVYANMAGDGMSGLVLSQIMYWNQPSKTTGRPRLSIHRNGYQWLAKSQRSWWDECCATAREARTAIRKLSTPQTLTRGILKGIERPPLIAVEKWKFDGAPTTHIRVLWENFLPLLNEATRREGERIRLGNLTNGFVKMTNGNDVFDESLTESTSEITSENESSSPQISKKTEIWRVLSEIGIWDSLIKQVNGNFTEEEIQAAIYLGRANSWDEPTPYIARLLRIWIDDEDARKSGVEMMRHIWHCGVCDRFHYRSAGCHGFAREHIDDWEWVIPRETG